MSGSSSKGPKSYFAGLTLEIPSSRFSITDNSIDNISDSSYDSDVFIDSDDVYSDYEEEWQESEQEQEEQKGKGKGKEKEENRSVFPLQIPNFNMLKRRGMRKPEVLLGPNASSPVSIF